MLTKNGIPVLPTCRKKKKKAKKPPTKPKLIINQQAMEETQREQWQQRKALYPGLVFVGIPERELYRLQGGRCFYCDTLMKNRSSNSGNSTGWTRDHVFPRYDGNGFTGNKVLSCVSCNREKADRQPELAEIERLIDIQQAYIGGAYSIKKAG